MKKIHLSFLFLILLICTFSLQSNTSLPAKRLVSENTSPAQALSVKSPTILAHDTCLNKKFSIVFYVILDYNNTLPTVTPASTATYITSYSLSTVISQLNAAFANMCVSFENCRIVTIPTYTYNSWDAGVTDSIITSTYYTPKTLNVYLPSSITSFPFGERFSYSAAFPTGTVAQRDFIVLQKNTSLDNIMHAIGHYFGLPHTFAEISGLPPANGIPSHELVNGTNSLINGDGFEDTDADCFPAGFNASNSPIPPCFYEDTIGVRDVNGTYYTPPLDNFMSAYACRCRFSQRQYNAMSRNILKKRMYLH